MSDNVFQFPAPKANDNKPQEREYLGSFHVYDEGDETKVVIEGEGRNLSKAEVMEAASRAMWVAMDDPVCIVTMGDGKLSSHGDASELLPYIGGADRLREVNREFTQRVMLFGLCSVPFLMSVLMALFGWMK